VDHLTIVNAVAMMARTVGDYIYRVEQPSIALGNTGKAAVITISTISPWFETLCMSADILIFHLLSEHDLLPIIEKKETSGGPTVYVNKIEQAAEYCERTLSADLSHLAGRKLIEEMKDKMEGSNP
jgi:hypothetical protein